MELTSKHLPNSQWSMEGIIRAKDADGNFTDTVLVHYLVFYDADLLANRPDGTAVYDALIADLQASKQALIEYYKKPVAQFYRSQQ